MDRKTFKKQLGLKVGDPAFALLDYSWAEGRIMDITKVGITFGIGAPRTNGSDLLEKYRKPVPFGCIMAINEASRRIVSEENLKFEQEAKAFQKRNLLKYLQSTADTRRTAIDKFQENFKIDPVYALSWYTDTVFATQYQARYASLALNRINCRCQSENLPPEEVVNVVAHGLYESLVEEQLRYDGVRSTSKMEVVKQESEAQARVKMISELKSRMENSQ